ncbi:MAG: FAD-binding protein [bacterium]
MARRGVGAAGTVSGHRESMIEGIASAVSDARARRTSLRIVGGSSWMDAGRPCGGIAPLDVGAHRGIVSYEPGDLTLTARAGTTLAEIAGVTAAKGQWLTMDPPGAAAGTLGATIATASAGPLATGFGTPRDHVLGCEFVSGRGEVVCAGGRVVKNVAGFDLVRLVTGAWGTLGALTEITVRLRALPEADVTLAVAIGGRSVTEIADAAWRWTRETEYRPLAAELLSPALARQLVNGGDAVLLVRLGGNARYIAAATSAVAALGDVRPVSADVWSAAARHEPDGGVVFRASTLPSRAASLFARLSAFAESAGGCAQATVARGVVRCVFPASANADVLQLLRAELAHHAANCTVVGERLPADLWGVVDGARTTDALAARVRAAFDPDGVMNPGILGAR